MNKTATVPCGSHAVKYMIRTGLRRTATQLKGLKIHEHRTASAALFCDGGRRTPLRSCRCAAAHDAATVVANHSGARSRTRSSAVRPHQPQRRADTGRRGAADRSAPLAGAGAGFARTGTAGRLGCIRATGAGIRLDRRLQRLATVPARISRTHAASTYRITRSHHRHTA